VKRFSALRRFPVELALITALGLAALYTDDALSFGLAASAVALTLFLLRNDTGIRLFAAVWTTAAFATAVYWDSVGYWRFAFVGLGVVAIWIARSIGAIVWPDVAIFFLVGLAVVAVRDAREKPPPPAPAAVAVFDLPKSRIRPPASELKAPSKVDIVALTHTHAARGGMAGTQTTRFEALLLTPLKRSGATTPVRVLIERGNNDSTATALARATVDGTTFVLLPASDCFVAPRQIALSHRSAMTILDGYGLPATTAKDYVDSFAGPIDFVPVLPSARFNRYFSGHSTVGRFLTKSEFATSAAARNGLELPERNRATTVQTVRVVAPAMTLRGRIKGGLASALQYVVLRTMCFDYGPGRPVKH
jgi:hypothetical protein